MKHFFIILASLDGFSQASADMGRVSKESPPIETLSEGVSIEP